MRHGGGGDAERSCADEGVEGGGDAFICGGHAAEDFHALAEIATEFDFAQFDEPWAFTDADLRLARGRAAAGGRVRAGAGF